MNEETKKDDCPFPEQYRDLVENKLKEIVDLADSIYPVMGEADVDPLSVEGDYVIVTVESKKDE